MWAAPAACRRFAGPVLSGEMERRAWVGWQGSEIGSHAKAARWLQMAWAVRSLCRIHRRAAARASPWCPIQALEHVVFLPNGAAAGLYGTVLKAGSRLERAHWQSPRGFLAEQVDPECPATNPSELGWLVVLQVLKAVALLVALARWAAPQRLASRCLARLPFRVYQSLAPGWLFALLRQPGDV